MVDLKSTFSRIIFSKIALRRLQSVNKLLLGRSQQNQPLEGVAEVVHTPYYSVFAPSVQKGYDEYKEQSIAKVLSKVADDRICAKVLQFVKLVKGSNI